MSARKRTSWGAERVARFFEICSLRDMEKRYPARVERNGQGYDVCYMRFGDYWFAIGLGAERAAEHRLSTYDSELKYFGGLVWC
jgi:hypothetical protein